MNAAATVTQGEGIGDRAPLALAAFEAIPWPALLFSMSGRVILANEAAEVVFGRALAAMSRRPLPVLLASDDPLAALFLRAQGGDHCRHPAVRVQIADVPVFEAEAVFTPLDEGRLLLTLHRESQGARLERSNEALRSVAGMGRTLAHEIKNPLAGIRGAAQLLKLGASPADAPLAQVIVDEVDRIHRLVDQVEAFSDEQAAMATPINIHRVLDRVRTLVASAFEQVAIADAYDPSLPLALGDQDQLVQIFLNIAKNAAEAATARGDGQGRVLISTRYRAGARIQAGRAGGRNTPLEVRIQDNGPGIAPDVRHRLFDAFVTTKTGGMGLGLTLVAKLVEAHGGLIEVESEPGRTVFHVLLPIAPAHLAPSESQA